MPASRDGALNVKGGALASCSEDPLTGFYRNGCCDTGADDMGMHTVCAVMTDAFLIYSKLAGNDLSTPRPEAGFAGLRATFGKQGGGGVSPDTPARTESWLV